MGLGLVADLRPAGVFGDDEGAGAAVFVRVGEDFGSDAWIAGVVVAGGVGDEALEFGAAALVAEGKEAQENDGQVALCTIRSLKKASRPRTEKLEISSICSMASRRRRRSVLIAGRRHASLQKPDAV